MNIHYRAVRSANYALEFLERLNTPTWNIPNPNSSSSTGAPAGTASPTDTEEEETSRASIIPLPVLIQKAAELLSKEAPKPITMESVIVELAKGEIERLRGEWPYDPSIRRRISALDLLIRHV